MQQSGKNAGESDASRPATGSGPNPALSDEQAEEFAASFTPAWDTGGDDSSGPANATLVDAPAVGNAQAAAVAQGAPNPALAATAPAFQGKQTLIGNAPAANAPVARAAASSSEAIDPENILDSSTAPQPPVRAAAPVSAMATAPQTSLKGTQIMQGSPAQVEARKAQSRPPPAPAPAPDARDTRNARVAVNADPFAASQSRARSAARSSPAAQSDDLDDFVPKKSSKTLYFVVAGLAIAAGVGLFLKFAMTDDGAKSPPTEHATGPAVTTAEIPPPPPKADTPPPTPTPAATTAAAKVDPTPPPATLPAPPTARQPEPPSHVAAAPPPRPEPRPRVTAPPPQAAAAPPPPPVTPKTPPKPANGSIVRDNPF